MNWGGSTNIHLSQSGGGGADLGTGPKAAHLLDNKEPLTLKPRLDGAGVMALASAPQWGGQDKWPRQPGDCGRRPVSPGSSLLSVTSPPEAGVGLLSGSLLSLTLSMYSSSGAFFISTA